MRHPELEFFNSLTGTLAIELTVPPKRIGNLYNFEASPDAQVKSLRLHAEVFNADARTFRDSTPEELDSVAFHEEHISLRSESGDIVTHDAPDGQFFTVRELLKAVEETEREIRGKPEWFGGVDVDHVFFERPSAGDY